MRIRDTLTRKDFGLTRSEAKIAQVLLDEYPISGLGTATALAKRAGVSDPTVIRLVAKIGFDGFAAFQTKLLEEVEAGLRSPLMMMEAKRPAAKGRGVAEAYMHSVADAVEAAAGTALPQLYDRAVDTIMGAKGHVLVLGGRFSRFVSGMLASYLTQFRSNVVSLGALSAESFDTLLDLNERDTLIVFDYRRYQRDVIRFAEQAADRGVSLILFTDPYRSPIAAKAKVVIVGRTEVGSPYDSLAPAVAQIEALAAHIVANEPRAGRARVHELEQIRTQNEVTLESSTGRDNRRGRSAAKKKP
jgi:DNA-binding MurR/RpiR family transcriptional regulator